MFGSTKGAGATNNISSLSSFGFTPFGVQTSFGTTPSSTSGFGLFSSSPLLSPSSFSFGVGSNNSAASSSYDTSFGFTPFRTTSSACGTTSAFGAASPFGTTSAPGTTTSASNTLPCFGTASFLPASSSPSITFGCSSSATSVYGQNNNVSSGSTGPFSQPGWSGGSTTVGGHNGSDVCYGFARYSTNSETPGSNCSTLRKRILNSETHHPFGKNTFWGGVRNSPYAPTPCTLTPDENHIMLSISGMPAYYRKSHEELRWEDYQLRSQGVTSDASSTPPYLHLPLSTTSNGSTSPVFVQSFPQYRDGVSRLPKLLSTSIGSSAPVLVQSIPQFPGGVSHLPKPLYTTSNWSTGPVFGQSFPQFPGGVFSGAPTHGTLFNHNGSSSLAIETGQEPFNSNSFTNQNPFVSPVNPPSHPSNGGFPTTNRIDQGLSSSATFNMHNQPSNDGSSPFPNATSQTPAFNYAPSPPPYYAPSPPPYYAPSPPPYYIYAPNPPPLYAPSPPPFYVPSPSAYYAPSSCTVIPYRCPIIAVPTTVVHTTSSCASSRSLPENNLVYTYGQTVPITLFLACQSSNSPGGCIKIIPTFVQTTGRSSADPQDALVTMSVQFPATVEVQTDANNSGESNPALEISIPYGARVDIAPVHDPLDLQQAGRGSPLSNLMISKPGKIAVCLGRDNSSRRANADKGKETISPRPTGAPNNNGNKSCSTGKEFHLTVPDLEGTELVTPDADIVSRNLFVELTPKLQRSDYYTEPAISALRVKEESEPGFMSRVNRFVIGRHGYGYVEFEGETDVQGLDLDSLIQFDARELRVYMEGSDKPPIGEGLNKPALVTLLKVKCIDKNTGEEYVEGENVERYREMLKKAAEQQGAEFISYNPVVGEWKFRVEHF